MISAPGPYDLEVEVGTIFRDYVADEREEEFWNVCIKVTKVK